MEGQIIGGASFSRLSLYTAAFCLLASVTPGKAQEARLPAASGGQAEMSLRKSVLTREFGGRRFTGEERRIGPGDSLWRILIEEKGLPERRFHSYLVVIRGLNPQVKSLDVLRVGDRIFVPLRLDDSVPVRTATNAHSGHATLGKTYRYQVKRGEHLYRILREQLKLSDEVKLAEYYALVKDLNPARRNWDNLAEGDIIRLPLVESKLTLAEAGGGGKKRKAGTDHPAVATAEHGPSLPRSMQDSPFGSRARPKPQIDRLPSLEATQNIRLPARDHLQLFAKVAEALGNEVQSSGEEVVSLPDGTIRLDKSSYPVVYNAALRQRVVLDPDGNIPASLKRKLSDPGIGTPVLAMAEGLSVDQAVRELLQQFGYQVLPSEKPVVVHQGGIAFEAKGDWMALAPEVSDKTQEILIINIAEPATSIPQYLKGALIKQGLILHQVVLRDAVEETGGAKISKVLGKEPAAPTVWPRDKREIVDALLLSFGVAFGVAENISIELRDGLRVEQRADRLFEWNGRRVALFFRPLDPAVSRALRDKQGVWTVELDIDTLSSREIIGQVLSVLGNPAAYGEHRFPAVESAPERLTVTAWGFHVPKKGMFVTDRQIPRGLHRFFFEKGLEIVYFH